MRFESVHQAHTALLLGGVELGDRVLSVERAPSESLEPPPPPVMSTAPHVAAVAPRGVPQLAVPTASVPIPVVAMVPPVVALPQRMAMADPSRLEEVARTVYVGNIVAITTEEELRALFEPAGPIAYVKMSSDVTQPLRYAFLEFYDIAAAQVRARRAA